MSAWFCRKCILSFGGDCTRLSVYKNGGHFQPRITHDSFWWLLMLDLLTSLLETGVIGTKSLYFGIAYSPPKESIQFCRVEYWKLRGSRWKVGGAPHWAYFSSRPPGLWVLGSAMSIYFLLVETVFWHHLLGSDTGFTAYFICVKDFCLQYPRSCKLFEQRNISTQLGLVMLWVQFLLQNILVSLFIILYIAVSNAVMGTQCFVAEFKAALGIWYWTVHLFAKQGFLHSMAHRTSYPVYKYISLGNWVQKQVANCLIFRNGHAYHEYLD